MTKANSFWSAAIMKEETLQDSNLKYCQFFILKQMNYSDSKIEQGKWPEVVHIFRECVRAGAAGSRTRRSSGHHVLNPQNFE